MVQGTSLSSKDSDATSAATDPESRPFSDVEIDYLRPFDVKLGRQAKKRWIALHGNTKEPIVSGNGRVCEACVRTNYGTELRVGECSGSTAEHFTPRDMRSVDEALVSVV